MPVIPPVAVRVWRAVPRTLGTTFVVLFIARVTLQSGDPANHLPAPFLCLLGCGNEGLRDLVSNIILCIPLGWVLRYWLSARVALAIGVVFTIGIETAQEFVLIGRDSSLRDILTNAGGGWLGIWLYDHWRSVRYPAPAGSRRLGILWLTGWLVVLVATGIGTHTAPTDRPWFGQWAGDLEQYAQFAGEVQDVSVNGWRPPLGPMGPSEPMRQGMARESLEVEVRAINSAPTRPIALMFAAFDDQRNELIFVGSAWRSVQFQLRTRFDAWELRGLRLRLPLSPGIEPGDTLLIRAATRPGRWTVSLESRGTVDSIALPLTMGLGWSTLLPYPMPIAFEWYVMNLLWLAGLIAPAAYYFHRASPKRAWLIGGPVVVLLLLVLPPLVGTAPTTLPEWIGTAIGMLSGVLLAHRARHRHAAPDATALS